MADNRYTSYANTPDSLGTRGVLVAASGSDMAGNIKALICIATGDITFIPVGNADNETITLTAVPALFIPPWRIRRVTAVTGTFYTIEG